jgi:primosomal protein N' (replication factor Y)
MRYVDIVVDNKSEYTDSFFTYEAPDDIRVGDKVTVPFARFRKGIDGYVFAVDVSTDLPPEKIRKIESVDRKRSLNSEMVDTAVWMRKRYGTKYIDGIKMFTVGGKKDTRGKIIKEAPVEEPGYELTDAQRSAVTKIVRSIDEGRGETFLLKGVTNSGKTEVYMRAVERCLELGRTAIVLVPEIALAAQTERRFKDRFGEETVAVLHSRMTTSQRLEQWLSLREGRAKIAVGARTAVFAPLENIGLIVIDEEHESTYKSDHNPKYETIDIAYKRASLNGASIVLGSATPSVVSYSRAKDGIYSLIEMNDRVGRSVMPEIELVDMRQEIRAGNMTSISSRLMEEIGRSLDAGEQIILFLNRRGFSTQIICPECGSRMVCPDCGITLTYHKRENAAMCHYCGRSFPVPKECPECGSRYIKFSGTGTEKVEEQVRKLFPEAVVDRFDLDTAKSQREIDRTLSSFRKGKTDILVGTQILAKGLDFRNVGLVGIIMADVTLNIPDYRSTERTFQLITQVAGRAGRDSGKSRVIIQTYEPDDDTIRAAAKGDYEGFFDGELLHRKIMNYPPYSDIISVVFVDKTELSDDDSETMRRAGEFRHYIMDAKDAPADAVVFEPKEDLQRGGAEKHRVYFIIKAPKGSRPGYIRAYMIYRDYLIKCGARCHIEIDVNPYGIM